MKILYREFGKKPGLHSNLVQLKDIYENPELLKERGLHSNLVQLKVKIIDFLYRHKLLFTF